MANHSLTLSGTDQFRNDVIGSDIVIENGDIYIPENATLAEGAFCVGGYQNDQSSATMKKVKIHAPNATVGCGLLGVYGESELTLEDVEIDAKMTHANAESTAAIVYGNTQSQKATLKNVTITNTECDTVIQGIQDADIDSLNFTGKLNKYVFSVVGGTIKNSSITLTNTSADEIDAVWRDANYAIDLNIVDTDIKEIPKCKKGNAFYSQNTSSSVITDTKSSFTDANNEAVVCENVKTGVASINGQLYTSFAAALKAAQDDDVIDMCGSTVMFKDEFPFDGTKQHVAIDKNITIKNGTIDMSGAECAPSNGLIEINGNKNVTFDGVTIKGKNYDSLYGVIYAGFNAEVTLKDCKMDLENEQSGSGAPLKSDGAGKFVIIGGTYIWNDTVRGITNAWVDINNATITAKRTDSTYLKSFFRNVFGTIKNSTISAENFDNGIENVIPDDVTPAGNEILTVSDGTNITFKNMVNSDVMLDSDEGSSTKLVIKDTASVTMNKGAFEAKVGDTYYATLTEAYDAASAGATVTLLKDVEMAANTDFDKAITIDLNNHTWKVASNNYAMLVKANVTFKNGTIDISNSNRTVAVWWLCSNGVNITFDKVNLTGKNVVSTGAAVFFADTGENATSLTFKNGCEIDLSTNAGKLDEVGRFIIYVNDITFENTEVTLDGFDGAFNTGKFTLNGTTDVKVNNGNYAVNNSKLVMNDTASLTANGCNENAVKLGEGSSIELNDRSALRINGNETSPADVVLRKDVDWTDEKKAAVKITVAKNATLDADLSAISGATITGKANTVSVEFEPVAGEDKTWNIVLVAPTETFIHEFTTAQLKFACNDAISYEIKEAADSKITVNEQILGSNVYLFNLKEGANFVEDSDKIVIGKVVFGDGYSNDSVSFMVDAEYENKVIATKGQNQREVFSGDTLTTDAVINEKFTQPICETTIKVATLENTGDNAKAYQDMHVAITGVNYSTTFDLGKGDYEQDENGNYVIETDLYQDNNYIITVTGAGYRTAKYQLRTQNKEAVTINFWANVQLKEDKLAMETNADGAEALAWYNFIAGDIIDDKKLDIFDLAAVVGYFGDEASENDMTGGWNKVKYDLNRDGVIDAEDVAIVLTAWKGLEKLK